MTSHNKPATRDNVVAAWWEYVETKYDLFLNMMSDDRIIDQTDPETLLAYVQTQRQQLENEPFPKKVTDIRERLLAALVNAEQCLTYRIDDNDSQFQLRFDLAKSNVDALRLYLVQYGIVT